LGQEFFFSFNYFFLRNLFATVILLLYFITIQFNASVSVLFTGFLGLPLLVFFPLGSWVDPLDIPLLVPTSLCVVCALWAMFDEGRGDACGLCLVL
jgi:hypothetical protein